MNDEHDNRQADDAMLARYYGRQMKLIMPETGVSFTENTLCRWCWRPLFIRLLHGATVWDLQYREYEHTEYCDARSDGATLSSKPHEPCGANFASIATLIGMAARLVDMPGTNEEVSPWRLSAMARLVCLAAGVPEECELWAASAIIQAACKRSEEFRAAAYRTGASDWPAP